MTEQQIFERVTNAEGDFRMNDSGMKCKKYSGSVFVEILKSALAEEGIVTSARDVFIEKVPVEIDLLIPRPNVIPRHGVLYRADDVLATFEVKRSGSYGKETLQKTKGDFELIRKQNARIECAYVSLTERRGYKWMATKDNIDAEVYIFLPYTGSEKKPQYEPTGDWGRLLEKMKALL